MADRNYGKTARGVPITDELVEKLAKEAEEGFDVEQIIRRRRGRPPIGASAASVESVRLEPELRVALQHRAQLQSATVSSLIREALWAYLAPDEELRTERQGVRSTLGPGPEESRSPLPSAEDARPRVHIVVGATVERSARAAPVLRRSAPRPTQVEIVTGQCTSAFAGATRIRRPLHSWQRLGMGA